MKIDSFVIRWSKRNRYSRCIDPSRVTRSAQAWWNMNFEEGISMRRCAFAFRSVLRTRRDDNMLTYTHQMRGERKRKREWKTEIGRKEGEGGGGRGNIGTNYESQSPSTQRDWLRGLETQNERNPKQRRPTFIVTRIYQRVYKRVSDSIWRFSSYTPRTNARLTIKSGRKGYGVAKREIYEICFTCFIFLRF